MKMHLIYWTIISVLVAGWVIHFIHHLGVEAQLEKLQNEAQILVIETP